MLEKSEIIIGELKLPVYSLDTLVIGSGAAGFNALDWLYDFGRCDIAMITEGVKAGTSRNTGSDKQTYYKVSIDSTLDSAMQMAETLFNGGSVNGDTALVEAACSVRSFIKLANLGVPFPTNIFGEYVGFKTDNDPMQRASSAGPLTSKFMTEVLEKSVKRKSIDIIDNMLAIKLIVKDSKLYGVLAIDLNKTDEPNLGITLFSCNNVIMATGGPAGAYAESVYPVSHTGMSGLAFEAGAEAVNLSEGQFLMGTKKFRWAVSGTYQQVLPRYIAIDKEGHEREFLLDYFDTPIEALNNVFLKGYQYPFDVERVHGSSIIDLMIFHETVDKGNRVFLDFRTEPAGLEDGFESLGKEQYDYLKNSNALIKLPIKRLEKMNKRAIKLFQAHGIDLYTEPIEVTICAQHNNGGIGVDINWESSIKGLYAAGEVAGTFGVFRPGGSALNSGQVGSLRAAEHIARKSDEKKPLLGNFTEIVNEQTNSFIKDTIDLISHPSEETNINAIWQQAQRKMSDICAHIRKIDELDNYYEQVISQIENFFSLINIKSHEEMKKLFKTRDALITQAAIISAVEKSGQHIGSRGSGFVVSDEGIFVHEKLNAYRYKPEVEGFRDQQVVTKKSGTGFVSFFRPIRPLPKADNWFENVWNEYNIRMKRIFDDK